MILERLLVNNPTEKPNNYNEIHKHLDAIISDPEEVSMDPWRLQKIAKLLAEDLFETEKQINEMYSDKEDMLKILEERIVDVSFIYNLETLIEKTLPPPMTYESLNGAEKMTMGLMLKLRVPSGGFKAVHDPVTGDLESGTIIITQLSKDVLMHEIRHWVDHALNGKNEANAEKARRLSIARAKSINIGLLISFMGVATVKVGLMHFLQQRVGMSEAEVQQLNVQIDMLSKLIQVDKVSTLVAFLAYLSQSLNYWYLPGEQRAEQTASIYSPTFSNELNTFIQRWFEDRDYTK